MLAAPMANPSHRWSLTALRRAGVRETVSNRRQVAQSQSAADAIAGFRWLARPGHNWGLQA